MSQEFHFSFGDPQQIAEWVASTADRQGDLTPKDIKREFDLQILQFWKGASERFDNNERAWKMWIESELFAYLEVIVHAGFTPQGGAWGDCVAHLAMGTAIIDDRRYWDFAQKADQFKQYFLDHGYQVVSRDGRAQNKMLEVTPADKDHNVVVDLGYESEAIALQDEHYNPELIDDMLIFLDTLPVVVPAAVETLHQFEAALTLLLNAAHYIFEVDGAAQQLVANDDNEVE